MRPCDFDDDDDGDDDGGGGPQHPGCKPVFTQIRLASTLASHNNEWRRRSDRQQIVGWLDGRGTRGNWTEEGSLMFTC